MKMNYFKKLMYIYRCLPFLWLFKNWWVVIELYLLGSKQKTVRLFSGEKFTIRHFLDALIIKEIFHDNDYHITHAQYKTIVDIGSNIGAFSVLAAKLNPNADIYSYEASPATYKLQIDNLRANNITNVHPFNLAICDKNTTLKFYDHQASGLSSLYPKRTDSQLKKVKSISLKTIIIKNNIRTIDFLKMDCEGAEYAIILSSPPELLKNINRMTIEYHEGITNHTHQELIVKLKLSGFSIRVKKHPLENDIGIIFATQNNNKK